MYDTIVVGAGPAGLTAAIYTSRRNLKTLIITKDLGGQTTTTPHIENYPGFKNINGFELAQKIGEQVRDFGVEIKYESVEKIDSKGKNFVVKTGENEYEGKTVILAFGKTPRSLNVTGEKKFTGKGISYCVTCDGPIFRDKTVAVIGGGNSALEAAIMMRDIAKKVYLIHRRDEFRGFESLVEKVKKEDKIELILSHVVNEFKGNKFLESMTIENKKTGREKELEVNGVFIEVGSEVKTDFVKDLVNLDDNYIVINNNCETSRPGIFAAGDVTTTPFKQIVVAAGEGAKAGLTAYNYINGIETTIVADWAKLKLKG